MLRLHDFTLTAGAQELLVATDWHLRAGSRVGLVGRNGAGKSTLLRAIIGEVQPEHGRLLMRGGVAVGYLPQNFVGASEATVWQEASSQMQWLHELEAQLATAQAQVEAHTDGAATRLAEVTERMRLTGAFSADERIGEVLSGLGFAVDDWHRSCSTLSGGWQMRVALARLLLSEPDLLLLDEPTNHLDVAARSWLAGFLSNHSATMIVVSHDRHLLDAVCNVTVEVRGRSLHSFSGNLSAWLAERARRDAATEAAAARQSMEIQKLERFVERFGAKANKARQAQSKQKALDRIDRIDGVERDAVPRLVLPDAPPGALEPIALRDVSLGWPGSEAVLTDVDLALERGMRLAVLGPNGCGKSTLLGALAGSLPPREGRRVQGRDVRISRFAQDLAEELDPEKTAIQAVQQRAPLAPTPRVRAALGALGLVGDAQQRQVQQLSGGERARVVLAGLVCKPANVLLLDEPSNHLDAVTVSVLADALREFEGTVVLVSHDRWLVEQTATHVAHVHQGGVQLHEGVRPEDFLPVPTRTGTDGGALGAASSSDGSGDGEAKDDWKARKARQRELDRARRRVGEVHDEIEAAEAQLAELDAAMVAQATDHKAIAELARQRQVVAQELDGRFVEWEELEALLEASGDPA